MEKEEDIKIDGIVLLTNKTDKQLLNLTNPSILKYCYDENFFKNVLSFNVRNNIQKIGCLESESYIVVCYENDNIHYRFQITQKKKRRFYR